MRFQGRSSPELQQYFADNSSEFASAIGRTIEAGARGLPPTFKTSLQSNAAGIVYQRTLEMPTEHGSVMLGEFMVPGEATSPAQFDRLSARYTKALGGPYARTSLWIPNWFSRSVNPIIEVSGDDANTETEALYRVHGQLTNFIDAETRGSLTNQKALRMSKIKMGEMLAEAGVIEVPSI